MELRVSWLVSAASSDIRNAENSDVEDGMRLGMYSQVLVLNSCRSDSCRIKIMSELKIL